MPDDESNRYETLLGVIEITLDAAFEDAEAMESFCAGGPDGIEHHARMVAESLRQVRAMLDGWHMARGELPAREEEA